MRFRLTTHCDHRQTTIGVDGELIGDAIPELLRLCSQTTGPFVLDLSNLERVDPAGLDLLRTLQSRGAPLDGISPYLGMLLQQPPNSA